MEKLSLSKDQIHILLLEGIHSRAAETFRSAGYGRVDLLTTSMPEEALLEAISDVHFLGIRSRTELTPAVFDAASKLTSVGCFCIGTNQVDLQAARRRGIPVFNAPFSNTRSVAELVIAQIIMLMRGIPAKNAQVHRGQWPKTAAGSYEIRGKRLGIIGYGHIGTQLGILAEGLGMRVTFVDIENKLPLGNSEPAASLPELLADCDVVSLHVPETPVTQNLMNEEALQSMKQGACLINASRGTVVDIDALASLLRSGHLAGAAIDVYPTEPKSNNEAFESPLRGLDNVILTPHIGGSTQEAQINIAREVAGKLVKYSDNGSTMSAVNFPQVAMPDHDNCRRIMHIHHNVPGMMQQVNEVFSSGGINIAAQYLQTDADLGYVVMDIDLEDPSDLLAQLKAIDGTIRARVLH